MFCILQSLIISFIMFGKRKIISKTAINGMVYQIRYLVNEKKVSDKALAWHLQNILSDNGIPVESIDTPRPWEWSDKT